MIATDELRRLLDERGMKWWPMCNNGYYEDRDTEFVVNGKKHTAHEWGDGFAVYNLTPEQAIAATLGNGTCEWQYEKHGPLYDVFSCSACKYEYAESRIDRGATDLVPNFCPNCGAKVVEL